MSERGKIPNGNSENERYDEDWLSLDGGDLGSSSSSAASIPGSQGSHGSHPGSSGSSGSGSPPSPSPTNPTSKAPCTNQCPTIPCDTSSTQGQGNSVQYATGSAMLRESDVPVPEGGISHVRTYYNQTEEIFSGPFGPNWWPEGVPSVGVGEWFDGTIYQPSMVVIFDPNNPYWFDLVDGQFRPRFTMVGARLNINGKKKEFTFIRAIDDSFDMTIFSGYIYKIIHHNPDHTTTIRWYLIVGKVISYTDTQGATTTFGGGGATRRNSSGNATVQKLTYSNYPPGTFDGQIKYVTYSCNGGPGGGGTISRAFYDYYPTTFDLKTVTQQLLIDGTWTSIGTSYYRYYSRGMMKLHCGPEAYRLMFNDGVDLDTASDTTVEQYADHHFEYVGNVVSLEVSPVCISCPGGGTTSDSFTYESNASAPATPDYNAWATKAVQQLPDTSTITVYSNGAGLPMLKVITAPGGTDKWCTFYRYDPLTNQLIWIAQPSAVKGYDDSYNDLLNLDHVTNLYYYLRDHHGLIQVYEYDGTSQYISGYKVRKGQQGTDVLLKAIGYTSNVDSADRTHFFAATEILYPNADDPTVTITTNYDYIFHSGTNYIQQKKTTLPGISTTQNGPGVGVRPTIIETYDEFGNLTERKDERDTVNTYKYEWPLFGLMTQQILDVGGENIATQFTYDTLGRLVQTLGPSHTVVLDSVATSVGKVSWRVYNQSPQPSSIPWPEDQDWVGTGYITSSSNVLVNPVSITGKDKNGRVLEQIMSARTSTSGTGKLLPDDVFDQSDWQTWITFQYNPQHQLTSQCEYFLIPSSGTGSVGTNYAQTTYGYDTLERRNRVIAGGGTITRTVWTTPQRLASVWVGTDDTGATDSNPAGTGSPNNMVVVTQNIYDGGSDGGDGNLTQVTQYAAATDTRTTTYGYDYRDRRISLGGEVNLYQEFFYDNLDRLCRVDNRDTTSSGNLIGREKMRYDDRSRVYLRIKYAVDPGTGDPGNVLTTNIWYDAGSNVIQQLNGGDGGVFSKNTYNGMGWVIAGYRGYNTSGTSYSQAITPSNDTIFEQIINSYDVVGNLLSQASAQRLNESLGTGPLSSSSAPQGRISYAATWFDGIDRPIANANYGVVASFTRYDTPPTSGSGVLVSSTTYDDDSGRISQTGDPQGDLTQISYDNAGRKTQTIEAATTSGARTTNFTYTLDNLIATLKAVNGSDNQITTYTYGTPLTGADVYRKDLLQYIDYPILGGSNRVSYLYNRLGQVKSVTDQRGTVRTIYYDKLGRVTNDCVTTLGSETDGAVLQIATAYEVRGMAQTITSYNSSTPFSGTVLNQVQRTFNSFGQLSKESQEHNGAIHSGSPNVQYGYQTAATTSNTNSRISMTYPNGRVVNYMSSTELPPINSLLNRFDLIVDAATDIVLAKYTYLGINTVIQIDYSEPGVMLDLWGGSTGIFSGIDQFGRITDQRWETT